VVDEEGRCVGVLSATDFLHWADRDGLAKDVHCAIPLDYCSEWQVVDLETIPKDEVRWHMTTDLVTTELAATITQLARRMLDAHIHRIVVLDEGGNPVGVVSSTDILAVVANATAEK
jgi:CBS-domain-containing membrane protein